MTPLRALSQSACRARRHGARRSAIRSAWAWRSWPRAVLTASLRHAHPPGPRSRRAAHWPRPGARPRSRNGWPRSRRSPPAPRTSWPRRSAPLPSPRASSSWRPPPPTCPAEIAEDARLIRSAGGSLPRDPRPDERPRRRPSVAHELRRRWRLIGWSRRRSWPPSRPRTSERVLICGGCGRCRTWRCPLEAATRALRTLVKNAFEASTQVTRPVHLRVEAAARARSGFAVRDNGVGMTADHAAARRRALLHHQAGRCRLRPGPVPGPHVRRALGRPASTLSSSPADGTTATLRLPGQALRRD